MKKSMILLAVTPLFFLSCACKPQIKYVYIKSKCPKLQTYDYNYTKKPKLELHYKIIK